MLNEGLIAGMSVVGEDFKHNILYVPEVLIAARAMKAGMAVLKPLLSAKDGGTPPVGMLLMGTVRGDLHDIGKNLVCMMAEGAGFEVHDIGVDQSVEKFMAAADESAPTIIGMSALLTTTMTYMKTVIDGFEAAGRATSRWRSAARRSARCSPTKSAPTATARTRRPRSTCSLPAGEAGDAQVTDVQDPLLAGNPLADRGGGRRGNEVSVELPPKFAERIDQLAAQRGLQRIRRLPRAVEVERRAGTRRAPRRRSPTPSKAELEAKADW